MTPTELDEGQKANTSKGFEGAWENLGEYKCFGST